MKPAAYPLPSFLTLISIFTQELRKAIAYGLGSDRCLGLGEKRTMENKKLENLRCQVQIPSLLWLL